MQQYLEQIMQMANLEIEAYDVDTRRDMQTINRKMDCYVMSYLKSGYAVLEINGKTYETGPGSIVIIPENVVHSHYKLNNEPAVFLWWHFCFRIQHTVDALKLLNFPVLSYLKDREGFENIFYRFYDSSRQMNKLSELLMHRACGLELMAYLVEELVTDRKILLNASIPEVFWQIFQEINSEENQRLSLDELSVKYHMSPVYISNRFKHYFGTSPMVMKNQIILERAKLMLQDSDMTVSEIAERSGFESIPGFTHFFTRCVKQSPTRFRTENRRL